MGGFFGAATKRDCSLDVFFGVDYHSHLGTRYGGMCTYGKDKGFTRQIHNITNTPFRTKFENDLPTLTGNLGIGCISDDDPQPLIVRSHLGIFAITTVGLIRNAEALIQRYFSLNNSQFMTSGSGRVSSTELVAAMINEKDSFVEGIRHVQDLVEGSITIMIMTQNELIVTRDKFGRLPILVGKCDDGYCVSFESFVYQKLGYVDHYELGPQEILRVTPEAIETLSESKPEQLKICAFMWSYYGYPNSNYQGRNVEMMRYRNGEIMARDEAQAGTLPDVDYIAGVPDSGIPHGIGYANQSKKAFARPFIKYTPTWSRSFTPTNQAVRNQVAKMKQIPLPELIKDKKLLLVDDSIVRGTQLQETVDFLYNSGAKEVHMRSACPPIMFGCKYLNFSRSNNDMELIARRIVQELEGDEGHKHLNEYSDIRTCRGQCLVKRICEKLGFDSLGFQSIDGLIEAIGIDREKICTYCWTGKE
ncbi:MAG: amidophosphoribosyltransferase [Duodenibacillus sp.]|nr:amidophosphoribosyltransferase [Duodenibacillus sp.]